MSSRLSARDSAGEYVTLVFRTAEPGEDFLYTARLIVAPGRQPVSWTIPEGNALLATEAALERANRELAKLGIQGLTLEDWKPTGYLVYQAVVPGWPRTDAQLPPLLQFPAVPEHLPGYLRQHIERVKNFVDAATTGKPSDTSLAAVAMSGTTIARYLGIQFDDLADVEHYVEANAAVLLAACESGQ